MQVEGATSEGKGILLRNISLLIQRYGLFFLHLDCKHLFMDSYILQTFLPKKKCLNIVLQLNQNIKEMKIIVSSVTLNKPISLSTNAVIGRFLEEILLQRSNCGSCNSQLQNKQCNQSKFANRQSKQNIFKIHIKYKICLNAGKPQYRMPIEKCEHRSASVT